MTLEFHYDDHIVLWDVYDLILFDYKCKPASLMKAVMFTLSFCSFIALLIVLWEAIDAPWTIHKKMLNVENE